MEVAQPVKIDNGALIDQGSIKHPILEEYARKYKPEELTADGIPTIETQLREMKLADEQSKTLNDKSEDRYKKDMITRVKCLALHKLGLSIMTDTFGMHPRERLKLQELMWEYNEVEHSKIIDEFNAVATEDIFDNFKIDYSKLPVYDV